MAGRTRRVKWGKAELWLFTASVALKEAYREWRRTQRALSKAKKHHTDSTKKLLATMSPGCAYKVTKGLMVSRRSVKVKRTTVPAHTYERIACKQVEK